MPSPTRRSPGPDEPQPHRPGQTTTNVSGEPSPRLPHEHDESADSQDSEPRDVMRQAHDDLAHGLQDTDRGVPTDEVYNRHLRTPSAPASTKPPRR
jgi:hypothetical protein